VGVWIAVIIPEWELLLCNLVSKITGWDCASVNALRNLLNQTSFSTQKKPSFKNGNSYKAYATRPKTPTTKQQGEMGNINQVRCEWKYFLFWNTRGRNLWLKRKKANWLGQRKEKNENLPYSRIRHNTFFWKVTYKNLT